MTDVIETPSEAPADEARDRNKAAVFAALAAAAIHRVTVEYDGSGDSGQIEDVAAWNVGNERVPLPSDTKIKLASDNPDHPLTEQTL